MARKKTRGKVKDNKRREALLKRVKQSYDRKESSGRGFFKDGLDVPFWQCKEGDHLIDIIPYIAGPNDPNVEEGEETYVLEVYVHQNVGVSEDMIICLAKTYNKPCPICEHRKRIQAEGGDEDLVKQLTPSRYPRVVYNIVCYDSREEEEKGVQVWHTSSYLMERYLVELAKNPRVRSEGIEAFVPFMDPDEGSSIAFTRKGSGQNTQFIGHKFVDRGEYIVTDEILEQAYCLDELIHIPSYEEVYELYWGEEEVEEDRQDNRVSWVSRNTRGKARQDQDEVEERFGGTEGDEDDNGDRGCPAGGEFGVDIDEFDECEECDLWTECAQEADRIEQEKEREKEKDERKTRAGGRRRRR